MFDLGRFLPYHINRTGVRLATAFGNELRRYSLTVPMWRVLAVLWHHGELKVNDLIVDTSIEQSTLSRLLVAMEKRGLVTRQRSAADARTVLVKLTPSGRKLTRELIPLALRNQRIALRGFSQEETDQLYSMLSRIYDNAADLIP
jgi:MarR family transcriptional regulator, organic hydroperoxide resistance regulator